MAGMGKEKYRAHSFARPYPFILGLRQGDQALRFDTDCMNSPLQTTILMSSVYKVLSVGVGCRLPRLFKVNRTTRATHPNSSSSQATDDTTMEEPQQ